VSDPLRVLVVDDEPPARELLAELLAEEPGVVEAGRCADGFEAVRAVNDLRPDVVLLDVQMPKLSGLEVAELIGDEVAVIFVTAYDEHAVRAFELHAVDYLLKPVDAPRLSEALARARRRLQPGAAAAARAARPAAAPAQRVLVRDGARVHVLPAHKLDYVEAQDDAVRLVAGGQEYRKQQPLAELEAVLDSRRFVRIHRSYLLNLDRLARIELYAKDSRVAILADGTRLPVSRSGYARLRELL